jgi:hypothetical protein
VVREVGQAAGCWAPACLAHEGSLEAAGSHLHSGGHRAAAEPSAGIASCTRSLVHTAAERAPPPSPFCAPRGPRSMSIVHGMSSPLLERGRPEVQVEVALDDGKDVTHAQDTTGELVPL